VSPKPEASYEAFQSLDIRIGRVAQVQPFPRARNPSYKVEIDFGPEIGTRWSGAQITRYTPEELVGRTVVCVVNFAPRNIAGFKSEVLIMGARNEAGEVVVLTTESAVVNGGEVF
jgi:tRNA-binding protein